jgi:multidrug resistance efflux pump
MTRLNLGRGGGWDVARRCGRQRWPEINFMPSSFFRSERFLESETFKRGAWGLLIVAILLALWIAWFFCARVAVYAVSEAADLEVDRAAHPVESQYSGRVVTSALALDREVEAGEVLIELDADTQKLQLTEERTRLGALGPQIQSLEDQIAAEQRASAQEQQTALVALDEARAHFREADAAAHLAESEAERLSQMYTSGVLAKADFERGQANAAERRAAADSLRLAVSKQEQQRLTDAEDRRARLEGLKSEINRLRGGEVTSHASIDRLEDEVDRRLIRAPINGRLGEVANVRVGSVVREGDKLAAVVPTGDLRIVASFQPADALGRIQPGQSARLRLDGFPWTEYGSINATVIHVGSEVRDQRIRVELAVNPHSASRIPMQHGLPGTVQVEVERISPASLLLRVVGKGFGSSAEVVKLQHSELP